jgi:prepilin-type N-terminal cleavage/methylation domain-containing protein
MAEHRQPAPERAHERGFTLAEMLAALAILLIGVTTLLASLGDSISLRRSTDARLAAAAAVEDVLVRVQQTGIRRRADAETDLDLELDLPGAFPVAGFDGLRCTVTAVDNKDRPDLWLLRVRMQWLEEGEAMTEEFLRVVPRQLPLGARVQRFRSENHETAR